MSEHRMERTIGLGGAVFTLVGYVVGAGIFILPAQLAGATGPGLFLSYLVAAIPALFACVICAQIGPMFPTSGATYVAVRTLLSPFWGFVLVWTIIVCASVAIAFVSYGFADYLNFFVPGLPPKAVAVGVLLFFAALNLAGVQPVVWLQALMVLWFMATLLIFGFGGLAHAHAEYFRPFFPKGGGAILTTAIPAYMTYTGLAVIAEIGEEIKDPHRTIPWCLAISFVVILLMYTLVPAALVGLIPWNELGGTEAAVGRAAGLFLPRWVAVVVSLSALGAAATSVNGILLAQTRDIFALARDRIFPARLGHVNARTTVPDAAVLLLAGLALTCILFGASITEYAIMTVQGVMVLQVLAGIAVYRVPTALPERYAAAPFKLPAVWHRFFCVGLIVVSAGFLVLGARMSPGPSAILVAAIVLGAGYYVARRRYLWARGVAVEELQR